MQQGTKVKAGGNRSRLIITLVVLAVLAIIVFFSLPVVQIPVEVTETYYDTEYQEEPYTEIETYTVPTTNGSGSDNSKIIFYDYLVELVTSVITDRWGTALKFNVDIEGKASPLISGHWGILDYNHAMYVTIVDPISRIVYQYRGAEASPQLDDFEFVPTMSGMYIIRFSSIYKRLGKYARLDMVLEWGGGSTQVTEQVKTREVIKYREVPVEVEKKRTTTNYKKGSVWQAIFSNKG